MDRALAPLVDRFGRVADDLRVSVTDRCNFRCTYCMPAEGLAWLPRSDVLAYEEIARLVGVFLDLGVRTVRLTGGEPLLRRGVETLVAMLAARDVPDLSMTTNGLLLAEKAEALAAAGLRRINVSVDSLLRHRFAEMTRRDALEPRPGRPVRGGARGDRSGPPAGPRRPRPGAGARVPLRRRRARGRRGDRERQRALLRRLQPDPHHRGRTVPHLPVRARGDRSPPAAARGRGRRPDRSGGARRRDAEV